MKKIFQLLLVAGLAVSLLIIAGGCSKTKVATDQMVSPPMETQPEIKGGVEEVEEGGGMAAVEEPLVTEPMEKTEQMVLEGRTSAPLLPIYFDFDRSNIRVDQRLRLEENAAYLKANAFVKVRIEGNTDERGTNEYNMALGERRAQSAKKYLINLGISQGRLKTLSYGEEKPLLHGHDELSWAQNRRDDFVLID